MSAVKFVCDEDTREALVAAVLREDPAIEITAVSEENAPPKGTLDRDLLLWTEEHRYAIVSRDRATLQRHVAAHQGMGRHTWGVFLVRDQRPWREIIDMLLFIWSSSEAEDWRDCIEWIP